MSKKVTTEEFIERARLIHGDKFDYSKTEYLNNSTKVCIICPIHGEFYQIPKDHLRGIGCKKCGRIAARDKMSHSKDEFIKKAIEMHGDKYDYSKVEYINIDTKVCVICPIHGEFWIRPHHHLSSITPQGCKKCAIINKANKQRLDTEKFIAKAKILHKDKYDYSKVNYIDSRLKVKIICPIHGEFEQSPNMHLIGQGCPMCNQSKMESFVEKFLIENNIEFEQQKTFDELLNKRKLYIDFYLPKYNLAIECQGKQHFGFGGWSKNEEKRKKEFEQILERDKRKYQFCKENNINLVYYFNEEYNAQAYQMTNKIYNEKNIINNIENILSFI